MKVEFISRDEKFNGKIISLVVDTIKDENGDIATREVVHHNGAACVVPIDENNYIYMVEQFRYPFGECMLEVPAGKKDEGEEPRKTAMRELKEETGIVADTITYLGEYRGNVALLTEKIYMYIARGLHFSKQDLDAGEYVEVRKYHIDEVVEKVLNNEIKDGKTIAAIMLTKGILDKEKSPKNTK